MNDANIILNERIENLFVDMRQSNVRMRDHLAAKMDVQMDRIQETLNNRKSSSSSRWNSSASTSGIPSGASTTALDTTTIMKNKSINGRHNLSGNGLRNRILDREHRERQAKDERATMSATIKMKKTSAMFIAKMKLAVKSKHMKPSVHNNTFMKNMQGKHEWQDKKTRLAWNNVMKCAA